MQYQNLKATFLKLMLKLDMYFDNKLMKEPRAKANLENHKDDLMQDLAVEVWANYHRPVYNNYQPAAFIWLKANKVWINFIRRLNRETLRKTSIEFDSLNDNLIVFDNLSQLESKDSINILHDFLKPEQIQILDYKAQGFSYKEIKELMNYSSENAAKTSVNRIRILLKRRFGNDGL